ncbi:MAG TPA: beta-ketoacyl synthase N-terminal-like domain-containing protein, partial [Candidatus Acidoferrum sp.]|nr:beta-ketoacyl synthase N-terminal-like domain-containing protein [Candidatus Acidoferrum sp.]
DRMGAARIESESPAELAQLLNAAPVADRRAELARYLASAAAAALGLDNAREIDPRRGFFDLGMDSLTAVEFRNRLQDAVGKAIALPRTLVFDYPTLESLSDYLAARMLGAEPEARRAVAPRASGTEPIAVIGLGCRFPGGADNPASFWRLMCDGGDAVTEVPADRWSVDDYYDANPDAPGKTHSRYGAFLRGVDRFDAAFFGISPREAASMDPQQRLLLEVAWEALENAGIPADSLNGTRSGAYIGISTSDYLHLLLRSGDFSHVDSYVGIGNVMSAAAGRLSYVLGLQGPSMAVDTACSSSLVAVHLAVRSLRSGECDLALAGGVNVILSPATHVNLSRAHMLSRDGRCKAFDADADGFVRGEGCGVVVLKRLSDAVAAGDRIQALIHGSAVNQDGRSSGITAPNGPAQQAVIREALADGGVLPADVDYVEAHGTGTSLGDPIELQALNAVLGEGREYGSKLSVGAVKTNIGHLEAAAGIAGLIKVVLSMQHREIPVHRHMKSPTPAVDWRELALEVATARRGRLRIAGISSFGFSGTNAHVIVGAAPEPARSNDQPRLHRLILSARSESALRALAVCYENYLSHTIEHLGDICYTAEAGRATFEHRAIFGGETIAEMRRSLREWRTVESDATSYRDSGYRKIALPTYPFERQRCWFTEDKDDRLYRIAWERLESAGAGAATGGEWIVVGGGAGPTLRDHLTNRGIECRILSATEPLPATA